MSEDLLDSEVTPRRRFERRLTSGLSFVPLPFVNADARGIDDPEPVRRVARRDSVYRRLLAVADLLGAGLALTLAVQVLGNDFARPLALVALPLVVLVAKVQGLYDRDELLLNKTTLDEAPKLFQVAAVYTLLIKLGENFLILGTLSARQLLGLWAMLFATSIAGRHVARSLARRLTSTERVLVIGSEEDARRVANKLAANPLVPAEMVGRVSMTSSHHQNGSLGGLAELDAIVRSRGVHRVIVAPTAATTELMLDAIRAAKALGIHVSVLPRLMEVVGSSVEFDHLYGMTVLGVRRFGLSTSSSFVKRGLDVAGAVVGLILFAPLFALLALVTRLSSSGEVLFRQQRVGKDGEPFDVLKFRTMVDNAEELKAELLARNEAAGGLFKIADDPRVTRVGRWLRRTSLDELPQLVNVLRGEMSLVGPRPLVPEEDERIEGRHRRRLHLKPGMTGQWQIFGSSKIPLREMVTIDYLYVANWSLWGDIKILCRTLPYMVARRGL